MTDENQVSDRRRFVRKLVSIAALGGLTGWLLGHEAEPVEATFTGDIAFWDNSIPGNSYDDQFQWFGKDLLIAGPGRIGLNQATPIYPLDIAGSYSGVGGGGGAQGVMRVSNSDNDTGIHITNFAAPGRDYVLFSSGGTSGIGPGNFSIYDATAALPRLSITPGGNVGIGTTNAQTMLHIFNQHAATQGNALIMDTPVAGQQALLGFWDHGTQKWQFGKNTDNSFTIWDQAGTKELMHGSSNGNLFLMPVSGTVGIGTYSPSSSYKVDVAGSVHATAFPTSSDLRFKEDITPIDDALEKVLRLNGVYFKWNKLHRETLKRSSNLTSRQVGLIAQQVKEVIPEIVSEWADQGADDYLAVDYSRLVAITIEAMKEQQTQIDALRSEIRELKQARTS